MDRNTLSISAAVAGNASLSARRAWIEIGIGGAKQMAVYKRRSPQGERG